MKKLNQQFKPVEIPLGVTAEQWYDWKWQMKNAFKTQADFETHFNLIDSEKKAFAHGTALFKTQTTPYYAHLMDRDNPDCPIRQMVMPREEELEEGAQQMLDPLGENKSQNRATDRLIHRYTDRALFLVTDLCGVYCRYCTRKHFTATDQVLATSEQLSQAVAYVKKNPQIKEIILSGGDPLTISNAKLAQVIEEFYKIESIELIRIGSRMPVVSPMRIDDELIQIFKSYKPIYMMTHFNHPREITQDSALALEKLVDNGIPVFNQLVLLNGINNHPDVIYALSRKLLSLRVKPYYMFQVDPSLGTDHLRTSIEDSLDIQKQLWGHTSGLAMPTYIVDIPSGGGKAALTPNFQISQEKNKRTFTGWDHVTADYISPMPHKIKKPDLVWIKE